MLQEDCTDEADDCRFVGKNADDAGAFLDLAVEAFERIGRMKLATVRGRELTIGEHVVLGFVHEFAKPSEARTQAIGNDTPFGVRILRTFLLERGQARPEVNFLGLEYAKAYCAYCADRIGRAGLQNIRMAAAEAKGFLKACVPDNSLWRVHIYFPDPWPKRKHHRRRLIQPGFIDEARRVLQVGGQLIVVTDHQGYFEQIRRVLHNASRFAHVPMPRMTDAEGEIVGTNFERKYIAQGRPFYSLARLRY